MRRSWNGKPHRGSALTPCLLRASTPLDMLRVEL
jgi:hypothetical protein